MIALGLVTCVLATFDSNRGGYRFDPFKAGIVLMTANSNSFDLRSAILNSPTFRQFRLALAIAASCIIFYAVGKHSFTMPEMGGARSIAAGPLGSWLGPAGLVAALLISMLISALITWPDGPHTGLFCATAGLCALAVRTGTIKFLLLSHYSDPAAAYWPLVGQAAFYLALLLVGALAARVMQPWFTAGRPWPISLAVPWPLHPNTDSTVPKGFPSSTGWLLASKGEPAFSRSALGAGCAALAMMVAIASLVEYITMRSLQPGQLIFALLLSFYIAGFAAGMVFKKAPDIFYIAAPMVTATVSYMVASHLAWQYPGYPSFRAARALPIYYASAGVVGILIGYYSAMRAVHHGALESAQDSQHKPA
jgi:hypothetical protein